MLFRSLIQQRGAQCLLLRFRLRRSFLRSLRLLVCRRSLLLRCQCRRISLCLSSRRLRCIPFRLQLLNLGLLPRRRILLLFRLRRSDRRLGSCLLGRGLLLRRAPHRDQSRISRGLHCVARRCNH